MPAARTHLHGLGGLPLEHLLDGAGGRGELEREGHQALGVHVQRLDEPARHNVLAKVRVNDPTQLLQHLRLATARRGLRGAPRRGSARAAPPLSMLARSACLKHPLRTPLRAALPILRSLTVMMAAAAARTLHPRRERIVSCLTGALSLNARR